MTIRHRLARAMNPINWMMPWYKAFGAQHPVLSTVGVCLIASIFFGGWWLITGYEYRESLKKTQEISAKPSAPTAAPTPPTTPAPFQGHAAILDKGNGGNVWEHVKINGFDDAVVLDGQTKNNTFKDLHINRPAKGGFEEWKVMLKDDAGNAGKISRDFDWARTQLQPIWDQMSADRKKLAVADFDSVEAQFMKVASDKNATLKLVEHLKDSPNP
jgi:hypothetical protein